MFDKHDILSITTVDGELRVKLGDANQSNGGEVDDCAIWGPDGFYSRPKPPDGGKACMALYVLDGHTGRVIGTKDNRIIGKYGSLSDGDRAIVGYGDARFLMKDSSDSVTLLTKNHASSDELMLLQLNGQAGEFTILLGGGDGTTLIKAKSGRIHMGVANGGSITIDADGVHITGNTFDCATGGGNLGVIGPVPPPVGSNSVVYGPVGTTGVGSTRWTVNS